MANLTSKDKTILCNWIDGRASLAAVESADPAGLVGNVRFSPAAKRAFRLVWEWSAVRMSSAAQDNAWRAHGGAHGGAAFIDRRIARCARIVAGLRK